MMRRVCHEDCAQDLGAWRIDDDLVAEAELPRCSRLLPRHLLKRVSQLRTQLVEKPDALGAVGEPGFRWTRRQAVEFIARAHRETEARELREVRGELAEGARLRVRTPIVVAIGNALEHASRRRNLRIQIGE